VKNYFASTAAQKFMDFSSTFKDLLRFQALSRALNFNNRIQALSRIFQALYEPCTVRKYSLKVTWKLFNTSRNNFQKDLFILKCFVWHLCACMFVDHDQCHTIQVLRP